MIFMNPRLYNLTVYNIIIKVHCPLHSKKCIGNVAKIMKILKGYSDKPDRKKERKKYLHAKSWITDKCFLLSIFILFSAQIWLMEFKKNANSFLPFPDRIFTIRSLNYVVPPRNVETPTVALTMIYGGSCMN